MVTTHPLFRSKVLQNVCCCCFFFILTKTKNGDVASHGSEVTSHSQIHAYSPLTSVLQFLISSTSR